MKNLANFHQSTQNSQSWDFDGILLPKIENVNLHICVMTIKNGVKFEEELTCPFKIDMSNLQILH